MIQEILLNKIATYTTPVAMSPLSINFCYGSNGSGKTTLSNVIGKYEPNGNCTITWENGKEHPVLAYNKRFVKANFGESSKLGGIFTLGKDTKEAQEFIAVQREEAKKSSTLIETFTKSKEKLEEFQRKIDIDIDNACWGIQQTHGETFKEALTGYRGSKRTFRTQCLKEFSNTDEKNPPTLKDIEELYHATFGDTLVEYNEFCEVNIADLTANESCILLRQRITGSSETPVGKFIEYLKNSDWVKQGIHYTSATDGKCPYCQQLLPTTIQNDIEAFFDEAFEKDCADVRTFQAKYQAYTNVLISQLKSISDNPIPLLKYDLFKSECKVLSFEIEANQKAIADKVSSPSFVVSINSIEPIVQRINKLIQEYNVEIRKNNYIVKNQIQECINCKRLVWKYFTHELRNVIGQYQSLFSEKVSGINSLKQKIKEQQDKLNELNRLITEKEETLTSVIPTVNAINAILRRFGFEGFELAENSIEKGTYKIVRPDGSNAEKTLSEGEYNFITFLYFYHLVYGSQGKSGIALDKVIVIDDPISSLDSNVIFIVSTLVRTLLTDCIDERNGIKQIFVLTHNVYFHKEITFLGSRKKYPTSRTAFWVIKKKNNFTEIIRHDENPIQTSYELLWAELKNIEGRQRATIFNTIRRILEYYFNVIGGIDYEKCIDRFEGEDKIICKALISCINDGSHFITDDFVMCYENDTIENYLRVFKLIFEKMDHISHYCMMMGEPNQILLNDAI